MKIYLDIDGTLIHEDLTENYGKPAAGLADFIIALRPHETYWLTTHCTDGNPANAQNIVKEVLPEELYPDIDRIQGTAWRSLKTEALDWRSDFIWFDNDIFDEEWKALKQCRENQYAIQIDLRADPKQLTEIIEEFL